MSGRSHILSDVRFLDWHGAPWHEGEGWPEFIELDRGEKPREAVRQVPARLLRELHASGYLAWGLEPPAETVKRLRAELEARMRKFLRGATSSRRVPLSVAAAELGIPERTLRDQVSRGARKSVSIEGRAGRELAIELETTSPVRVRLRRFQADPRRLLLMAREGVKPGASRLGYTRRGDGLEWHRAEKLAGLK
jgi:hypothetical protein